MPAKHCEDHVEVFAGIVRVETKLEDAREDVRDLKTEVAKNTAQMTKLAKAVWILVGAIGIIGGGTGGITAVRSLAQPSQPTTSEVHHDHIDEDKAHRIADARDRSLSLRAGGTGADTVGDDSGDDSDDSPL